VKIRTRSFTTLLDHLATLTRVDLRFGAHQASPGVPALAKPTAPTPSLRLLGAPMPLTLK